MEHMNRKSQFNPEEAVAAAKDYALATGMECLLLTADDEELLNPCAGQIHEKLCYSLNPEIAQCCRVIHFEGALRAAGDGKAHSYFCPMGLMHWAAPIIREGKIIAAFVAGHTFLNQPQNDLAKLKTLSSAHEELLNQVPDLKKILLRSPVIDGERLNAMKKLLERLAASFSDDSGKDAAYRQIREAFLRNANPTETPAFSPEKLFGCFDKKDSSDMKNAIKAIAAAIAETKDISAAKASLTGIILAVYDRALDRDGQSFFEDRCLAALNEIDRAESSEELCQWTENHLKRLIEAGALLPRLKNANMIYSALQYINDHYSEKFSLQDIADHVHFSAPYFSKVFKREMETTFSKYLTDLRIEKSKELLKNSDVPLADIPALVGFEEQSYFTRVFRTNTGISPGKYREQKDI